jgi:glycerol-3-phosphate acyltransferase PlsY
MLKGTAAVLIAEALGFPALVAGLGAFLGHLWPVWLRFKGGKGVATYLGVLLGLAWPFALAFAGIWIVVAFLSRYSSLSALVASAAVPVLLGLLGRPELAGLFGLLGVLLWFRHAANLRRLMSGTEGRIGGKG